jgi:hypothetical protein
LKDGKVILENREPNYSATVIKVHTLVELPGMDKCWGVPMLGYQVIARKDSIEVGQLGVLFTAETQLSESFCKNNNLYESVLLNNDTSVKGYLKDTGRVRSIKLRGHRSDALFLSLKSLEYLGVDINQFKEGDSFTHVDGVEVCRKYLVKQKQSTPKNGQPKNKAVKKNRVEAKLIPEHVDSTHWTRAEHTVGDKQWVIVTQKLHGTSVRLAHQICNRELTWKEKVAKWFGVSVQETEYDYFACSRRVIKDHKRKDAHKMEHYYSSDLYNRAMEKVGHVIPKGWIIYGELIGWDNDKPIQPKFTYNVPPGQFELYVYRIAQVNPDGVSVDLAWGQVKDFCDMSGLKYTPEIWQGEKKDFRYEVYMDKHYYQSGLTQCIPTCEESMCDEGVVVRVNGLTPRFLKAKSPLFTGYETKLNDDGVVDMETAAATEEASDA